MAGLYAAVQAGDFERVKSEVQTAKDKISNKVDSVAKVKTVSKDEKVKAANPDPDEIALKQVAVMTEGVLDHPTVKPASKAADFYRRGRIVNSNDPALADNIFNQNTLAANQLTGTGNKPVEFAYIPRFVSEIKEEEPASIRLIGRPSLDSKSQEIDLIPPYTKFFLEGVQEGHQERTQIVETFGDFYVFFFGERPPVYTFTGTLLNTNSINWAEDFMFFYDNFLRGTKCVELNSKLILTYGGKQIEGFLMGMNTSTQAISEKGIQLSFQVLVIDRKILKLSVDFGLIESNGRFNADDSFIQLLTKGLSNPQVSEAYKKVSEVVNAKTPPATAVKSSATDKDRLEAKFGVKLASLPNGTLKLAP